MSLQEYRQSEEIYNKEYDFYALIMAAMRQADTFNLERLACCFPDQMREVKERFNLPGGMYPAEQHKAARTPESLVKEALAAVKKIPLTCGNCNQVFNMPEVAVHNLCPAAGCTGKLYNLGIHTEPG